MTGPDTTALAGILGKLGLGHWFEPLRELAAERMSPAAHGDYARWQDAVGRLPAASSDAERRALLMQLAPWRKGPFDVGGVHIDAEWRSDLKWRRFESAIAPLAGRRVLDVGCGNGYYALRMAKAGASAVLGIDPTLLYVMQFLAVTAHRAPLPVVVLPLRLEELPDASPVFDTTFSMGVLYHQPRRPAGAGNHLHPRRGIVCMHARRPLRTHEERVAAADAHGTGDLAAAHGVPGRRGRRYRDHHRRRAALDRVDALRVARGGTRPGRSRRQDRRGLAGATPGRGDRHRPVGAVRWPRPAPTKVSRLL
jgi:SAM-dependent methyltransferase